ncbi:MAG: site-2 protease family protein [Methanobacterium sp.]|nr:site-2 protease family protein [Methanobacterium sp.]
MNVLWYYAIGFIIIWTLAILFKDRLKIDIEGPLLMRRTQRLRDSIDYIANLSPKCWIWIMNLGLPVAFFFMAVMLILIINSLPTTFSNPSMALVLPGIDIPGSPIVIPLGYGIIALMTVMIVHEFGHGIIARVEGVKIKSIGVLLLAVLPGAFVEPDEEDIKKSPPISKLRIYAAGSIFNLILALKSYIILVFIGVLIIGSVFIGIPGLNIPGTTITTQPIGFAVNGPVFPTFHEEGVEITRITPKSPADGILTPGTVVQSINGVNVTSFTGFTTVLNHTHIGENVTFQTTQGNYSIIVGPSPKNSSRGYIGIEYHQHLAVNSDVKKAVGEELPWFIYSLQNLFFWILLLNLAIGTFNLLPMKPLDGGLLLEELLSYKLSKDKVKKIINPLSYALILIIGTMIIYSIGRGISLLF